MKWVPMQLAPMNFENSKFLFSDCADEEEEFPIKMTTTCSTQPQKPSWYESGHQNAKFDVLIFLM